MQQNAELRDLVIKSVSLVINMGRLRRFVGGGSWWERHMQSQQFCNTEFWGQKEGLSSGKCILRPAYPSY